MTQLKQTIIERWRNFLSFFFLLLMVSGAFAQAVPVVPGEWSIEHICDSCTPKGLTFYDSLYGMLVVQDSKRNYEGFFTYITTNGGTSWVRRGVMKDFISFSIYPPGFQPPLTLITPSTAIWRVVTELLLTRDSGRTWDQTDAGVFPGGYVSGVLPLDTPRSLIFLAERGRGIPTGRQYIKPAIDLSFRTFEDIYGDTVFPHWYLQDIYFEDSSNIWTEYVDSATAFFKYEHSVDGGISWSEVQPYAQLAIRPTRRQRIQGNREGKIFLLPDFVYSTNHGVSWEVDSIFGNRISKFVTPDAKHWWALIGSSVYKEYNYDPLWTTENISIDTIAFSSNRGETWRLQQMYPEETLFDIVFPDPWHGYISTYREGATYVYKVAIDEVSAVERERTLVSGMEVFPLPADKVLHMKRAFIDQGEYHIINPLGRVVDIINADGNVTWTLDCSRYANGMYSVLFKRNKSIYNAAKFIILH